LLYAAWGESVPLFREFSQIGRLQMLESALIALELESGNIEEAARLSMRMIIEDEYLLDSSFVTVADALFRFMNLESSNAPCWSPSTVTTTKASIRRMLRMCKNSSLDTGKAVVLCFALGNCLDETVSPELRDQCLLLYEKYSGKDNVIGLVAGAFFADVLKRKGTRGVVQPELIHEACRPAGGAPAAEILHSAYQLLADSEEFFECDASILLITDDKLSKADYEATLSRYRNTGWNKKLNIQNVVLELACTGECISGTVDRPRTSATRGGHYVCTCSMSIERAFDHVSAVLVGSSGCSKSSQQGITMERF
jgi:hypothetical protein